MAARRSVRLSIRQSDAWATREVNRVRKTKERARRDARIREKIQQGPPYSPTVMSWLSRRLDKRAGQITQEDIQAVLS